MIMRRGKVGDSTQPQPPEEVGTDVWRETPLDQPGGGTLRWAQLGPHMLEALNRVEAARGRRLAEALHALDAAAPRAPPPTHSEWNNAMELVGMRRVVAQSYFNIHALIVACMSDWFPAELCMTQ